MNFEAETPPNGCPGGPARGTCGDSVNGAFSAQNGNGVEARMKF